MPIGVGAHTCQRAGRADLRALSGGLGTNST